jgi:serine/threonine-protein kinase RsbT
MASHDPVALRNEHDVVAARQLVRSVTGALKFSLVDQTKLVTAVSELARNTVVHGGGGTMNCETAQADGRSCVRLTFEDQGPGIADIALAMKDGYTTGNGLGLGLPGTKRLVNEFHIESTPGRGTRIVIARWK